MLLLREGLDALDDSEPRLALRMIFRLAYRADLHRGRTSPAALVERAQELDRRLGDTESRFLARCSGVGVLRPGTRPVGGSDRFEECLELNELAERCGREDLLFRAIQMSVIYYALGRSGVRAGDRAGAEIADRLGSPRFMLGG